MLTGNLYCLAAVLNTVAMSYITALSTGFSLRKMSEEDAVKNESRRYKLD